MIKKYKKKGPLGEEAFFYSLTNLEEIFKGPFNELLSRR